MAFAFVSTQWFLCLFVNSLPPESCLRVWDMLFFETSAAVLFRVALALFDIYTQVTLQALGQAYILFCVMASRCAEPYYTQ